MSRLAHILVSLGSLLFLIPPVLSQPPEAKKPAAPPRIDAQGDGLPPGALVRLGSVRLRHNEAVLSTAYSPDGKLLASAGSSGVVRLWNAATWQLLQEWPKGTATLVRFTNDGKHLICSGEQGLTLRDATTGQVVQTLGNKEQQGPGIRGRAGDHYLALAPDGKMLAWVDGNEVILWNLSTGQEIRRLKDHTGPVGSVAFSPDGKILAAGTNLVGKGDTIVFWEVATGKDQHPLIATGQNMTYGLAFAPDGKTLASSSPSDTRLWDVATREERNKLNAGGRSLAFSRDGKFLAVASSYGGMEQGFVHVWNPSTGKPVHTFRGHVNHVHCLAFAPDSQTLASGGPEGTIRLWDPGSGQERGRQVSHQSQIRTVAFSQSGTLAATVSGADHLIRIWGTASGAPLARMDIPCERRAWWCADGHGAFLMFGRDGKTLLCDDKVYDVTTGGFLNNLPGMVRAQSAYGKLLAGLAGDRFSSRVLRVAVWDRVTGRELSSFTPYSKEEAYDATITAVAFSPDGRRLAIGVSNRNLRDREAIKESVFLYEIESSKLIRKLRPNNEGPNFLLFSPDGEMLITSGLWRQPVQLWRVFKGQEAGTVQGQDQNRHWSEYRPIALSADGKLLALGGKDNTILLWEMLTGREVHRLEGHQGPVRSLAFAPDGRSLLSSSADITALIWDLAPQGEKVDLSAEGLRGLWNRLAGDESATAYRSAWALARAPQKTLDLFKDRLKPLQEPDLKQVPRLLADLDAEQFAVRTAAYEGLRNLGPLVEDALRKALEGKASAEVRKSVELLLSDLHEHPTPPEQLRQLRAIQVLEWIGTPAAAGLLEPLARGAPALRPTRDAEAALRRLKARQSAETKTEAPRSKPAQAQPARTLAALKAEVTSLAFTSDGKLVAAAVDNTVQLLDPITARELRKFKADARSVLALTFAPDGKTLATGGADHKVHLWDRGGEPIKTLEGHFDSITAIAFTPDGKLLASASRDRTIGIWDAITGQLVRKLKGPKGQVTSVAFSPDGKTLASGDLPESVNEVAGKPMTIHPLATVRLWDVATGQERERFPGDGHLVAFAPDGTLASAFLSTRIVIGDNAIVIEGSGNKVGPGQGEAVIKGTNAILLRDLNSGQSRLRLGGLGTALAFSADGRFLATGRGTDLHHGGKLLETPGAVAVDGRLRLWQTATGQEVLAFPADVRPSVLAIAPDGQSLVAGTRDGNVLLWELKPGGKDAEPAAFQGADGDQLWNTLAGEDAAAAYRALWKVRASGPEGIRFLKGRLQPAGADDPQLRKRIAALDAEQFQTRETALRELQRRGADAEPALCRALQQAPSLAVRERILMLLNDPGIVQHPDPLGRTRALAVLEAVGSAEARQVLEVLAGGSPLAKQTQEARAALERLGRR